MKKASSEMWWIIIGAVIALVVLIILLVMFTGKTTGLEQGLLSCENKGGSCIPAGSPCQKEDGTKGSVSKTFTCGPESRENAGGDCCFK